MVRTVRGVGRSVGAAVTGNRALEDFEAAPLAAAASILLVLAAIGFYFPRLFAWSAAGFTTWLALTFVVEAWTVWRHR